MWRYAASLLLSLLFIPSALATTQKNVLILHEGSRLLTYQFLLSSEMQADLASTTFDVHIFEEYLDSWHLTQDPKYALDALEAKYAGRKFDVVVVDGNAPFQAMLSRPPAFLQGAPVVFLTVPDYDLPSRLPPNITGVTVHKEYGAAARLAERLQPGLRHLYYVEGGLPANALRDASLHNELAPLLNHLDIVSLQDLPVDDLLKRVKSLPPHSAILFDSYLKDPSGKVYVPADVCNLIAKSANAPVYALFDTIMGEGAVGGVVIGFRAIGKQAAGMVIGLLSGAPLSQFPVVHSQNQIMIDWRNFQRFGLSESRLPSSAIIINRPPTAWEKYREYLITAVIVIVLQTVLIIELGLAVKLRKKSERTARELARRLINAQEDERRRLAGELHDDVSQRLALVAVHLDMLRNAPPASRNDLIRELSVLYDQTDLISSDIHQFSHELHPNILERLGLASALRRYCAEFSAHRNLVVQMTTTGEEPQLDQATALAFFRIGQECLMNVAKHSGAAECNVSLTCSRDRIILAVEDKGSGFDAKKAKTETGLGIQSMRERLRSIGGTLRIQSSALHGTSVFAAARVKAGVTPEMMREQTTKRDNSLPPQIVGNFGMSEAIRRFDWASTSLGAISLWSETLTSSVNTILSLPQPGLIFWGPEMVMLYNDAFVSILSDRHPALGRLGREFWTDAWPVVGDQLESVLRDGSAFRSEGSLVPILRNGILADAWFDYSYSPLSEPNGSVSGILVVCEEVTSLITSEREAHSRH